MKFLVLAVVLRFFETRIREWLGISEADLAEAEWEDASDDLEPDYA